MSEFTGLRKLFDTFSDAQFYPKPDFILHIPLGVVRKRREFEGRADEFLKATSHLPDSVLVQLLNERFSVLTDYDGNLLKFA